MAAPVPLYAIPTLGPLRWLTDPVRDVPGEIRNSLLAGFFTPASPVVVGSLANTAVNVVAAILHPCVPFFVLLALDVIVVSSRISGLLTSRRAARQGQPTQTDTFLCLSLCWAAIVGTGTAMCVGSGDPVLQFLAPTTMMGITCGITTRLSGAPRFAIAQIILCDIPLQFVLPCLGQPWMMLSLLQCPLFVVGMTATVRRLNHAYVSVLMAEKDSERRATHDGLTGTLNRDGVIVALSRDLKRTARDAAPFALFYMDLDGFKSVNDGFGHGAGDELLRQVAVRIAAAIPETCCLGRLGGDEFVVGAPGLDAGSAAAIGEAIVAAIAVPFDLRPGIGVHVGISIGITCATPSASVDDLLMAADAALYRAKSGGRSRCFVDAAQVGPDRQAA